MTFARSKGKDDVTPPPAPPSEKPDIVPLNELTVGDTVLVEGTRTGDIVHVEDEAEHLPGSPIYHVRLRDTGEVRHYSYTEVE